MNLTAVILCGGQGTRLQNVIGPELPKCLAPVAGKPFLCYLLDQLHQQGIKKTVLCAGWKEQIQEFFGADYAGMSLKYCYEAKPLGTGGALRRALYFVDSDPVLVMNGDTYCPFDLKKFYDEYIRRGCPIGRVFSNPLSFQDSGIRLLSRAFIQYIPKEEKIGMEDCLQLFRWNTAVFFSKIPGFLDIGTPEGYASAETFLRNHGGIKCPKNHSG